MNKFITKACNDTNFRGLFIPHKDNANTTYFIGWLLSAKNAPKPHGKAQKRGTKWRSFRPKLN